MNKIFVTGADGFIGSHLVELLVKKCFSVNAFCLYNSQGSWGWLDSLPVEVKENINVNLGDIRDPLSIRNGAYEIPTSGGWGLEMEEEFVREHTYPTGRVWQGREDSGSITFIA